MTCSCRKGPGALSLVLAAALVAGFAAAPASGAIKIYETSEEAKVLGKFRRGECTVRGRGNNKFFRAKARSTNRDFRLELDISAPDWKGYGREYDFRYGAPDGKVFYLVGRGSTYSNAYAPPGLEGQDSGGVAFRGDGRRMSAGFLPTPTQNFKKGVVLAGVMRC